MVVGHKIPLVKQDDEGTTTLDGKAGNLLVLLGDTLGGIDDKQANLRLVDGAKAPDEAVVLDVFVNKVALAHAGGVDEAVALVATLDDDVEGVARRAGDVAHDGTILAGKAVGDRGLADVRAANNGNTKGVLRILGLIRGLRESCDDLVEKVSRTVTVDGGNGPGLTKAEGIEIPHGLVVRGIVELVGYEEDGLAGSTQDTRNRLVLFGHADGSVDDEDDDIRLLAGGLRLLADAAGKGVIRAACLDATGVNESKLATTPVCLVVAAISGDATAFVDDGFLLLCNTVNQRGLADVGASDDGDDGLGHECSLLECSGVKV